MAKRYIQPGERVQIEAPYSEVCMYMRIAGKPMQAEILPGRYAAQLYTPDGRPFSSPVTPGEAGFYQDDDGFYISVPDPYAFAGLDEARAFAAGCCGPVSVRIAVPRQAGLAGYTVARTFWSPTFEEAIEA